MVAEVVTVETVPSTTEPECAEDVEAKALMEKWAKEIEGTTDDESHSGEDDEDAVANYDEYLEQFRRDVAADDNALDHVALACGDLEQAMDAFEGMTGLRPVMVCSLNGLGTRSARVAFDECCFLEIVAPDPKQTSQRPLGDQIEALNIPPGEMIPLHYAIRRSDCTSDQMRKQTLKNLGYTTDQVTMVAQDRGMPWKWDYVFVQGHGDGGLVPFYVNCGDAHHAAGRLPVVGSNPRVRVTAPASNRVHELLRNVDCVTSTASGEDEAARVEFSFTSPRGTHTFAGTDPLGIRFPMEGGIPVKGQN